MSAWREPNERDRLVERIVAAERRASFAERRVRALEAAAGGTDLSVRVAELEATVEVLNERIAQHNGRKKAG